MTSQYQQYHGFSKHRPMIVHYQTINGKFCQAYAARRGRNKLPMPRWP